MQLYFALLFNANLKGFVTGKIFQGDTKKFCAPGINCYSCPGAIAACPLGSLQGSLQASNHNTLYYVGGILLLYCIMFGRMICGWLCPFGLVQEVVYKIKSPKLKKSPVTRILSFLKYALLVYFVFIIPIMYAMHKSAVPGFCKYICPAGVVEGAIPLLSSPTADTHFPSLGSLFTWKFMLTVSIIVGSIFIFRLFCRFICPLGALYGLFNKISIFGIKVDNSKCTHCGLCHSKCKVDIKTPGDQECISCGECVGVCPTKAIQWKGPKILLAPNEGVETLPDKHKKTRFITRCITAGVMISILVGAVVYFWVTNKDPLTPQKPIVSTEPSVIVDDQGNEIELPPLGNQVGDLCYGTAIPIVDGKGDTGETLDPTKTGKITIINFWGTWCGPCVDELPDFHRIAEEYSDSVTVVAIHSVMLADTAPQFIASTYPQTKILFSADKADMFGNMSYYDAIGGTGGYPVTVVLDENGVIQASIQDSVHYDELASIIETQLAKQN